MIGFEWDEAKRLRNIEDHGVDFRLAARIFGNPVIESEDDRSDYAEARVRALGHAGEDYYLVAYTWRGKNRRIISAWRVGNHGRKRYQAILSRRP
jgi:uncharacterized DUF497 family protein